MSALALPGQTRDRLVKILGLTGSDHDGEVLSAARTAHRILTSTGLTWNDVIPSEMAADPSDLEMVGYCLDHPVKLTAWERGFLQSIQRLLWADAKLSVKQRGTMDRLYAKCHAGER